MVRLCGIATPVVTELIFSISTCKFIIVAAYEIYASLHTAMYKGSLIENHGTKSFIHFCSTNIVMPMVMGLPPTTKSKHYLRLCLFAVDCKIGSSYCAMQLLLFYFKIATFPVCRNEQSEVMDLSK